jgi:rhodanese-related sulfurtransferase
MGYEKVFVMPEGLLGWKRLGKPLESLEGSSTESSE